MYNKMTKDGLFKIREGIDLLINAMNDEEKNAVMQNPEVVKAANERKVATPTSPKRQTEPKATTAHFTEEDLSSMAYNDLKKLARDLGVSGAGSRDKIIERILGIDLNVEENNAVTAPASETAEGTQSNDAPKAKKSPRKLGKKSEPDLEPEEVTHDPVYEQVLEVTEDMSIEELGDVLSDIGMSPKGKRQALIDKIYSAVKDGKLSLDDEDEADTPQEQSEVNTDDHDEEDDGVNDPDNMTNARKEACEAFEDEIRDDFSNGELGIDDMKEFCLEFYGEDNADEINSLGDEQLLDIYIDAVKRMINDKGELIEEGAYEVNGEYFCCGRPLQYAEDTNKYICEMCGEEYDAE